MKKRNGESQFEGPTTSTYGILPEQSPLLHNLLYNPKGVRKLSPNQNFGLRSLAYASILHVLHQYWWDYRARS